MFTPNVQIKSVMHVELYLGFVLLGLLTEGDNTYWTVHGGASMEKMHRCDEFRQAKQWCECQQRLVTTVTSNEYDCASISKITGKRNIKTLKRDFAREHHILQEK